LLPSASLSVPLLSEIVTSKFPIGDPSALSVLLALSVPPAFVMLPSAQSVLLVLSVPPAFVLLPIVLSVLPALSVPLS